MKKKKKKSVRLSDAINPSLALARFVNIFVIVATITLVVLGSVLNNSVYFIVAIVVLLLDSVAYLLINLRLPKRISSMVDKGLTSDLNRALNSMTTSRDPIYLEKSGIVEFDDVKSRFVNTINSFRDVVIIDRDIDEKRMKFEYEEGFDDIITRSSFTYNLPFILKLNSYSRGGVILTKLYGYYEGVPQDAINHLAKEIRANFSTKTYIGFYSEDTLITYVADIESLSVFETLLQRLYSRYSYLDNYLSKQIVITCKIGASVFPYSLKGTLVSDANQVLEKTKNYGIFLPETIKYGVTSIESTDDLRRKQLILLDDLIGKLYKLGRDINSEMKVVDDAGLQIAEFNNFDVFGVLTRPSTASRDDSLYLFKEKTYKDFNIFEHESSITFKTIAPLIKYKDNSNCFYSTRREDLPPDAAEFFDKYNLNSFYCYFFGFNNKILGMIYFGSRDKSAPLTSVDFHVVEMGMMALGALITNIMRSHESRQNDADVEAIMKLDGRLRYKVVPKNFDLLYVSDGIKDLLGDVPEGGIKCHKFLFNSDKPCDNCPYVGVADPNSPIVLGKNKYLRRKLSVATTHYSAVSMLLEPYIDVKKSRLTRRFDPQTYLLSRDNFNSEIDNLVVSKSKGSLLFIVLEGIGRLVHDYGELILADIFKEAAQRITSIGLDEKIYRYDDGVLAIYFNDVPRTRMYNYIENIHEAISRAYSIATLNIQCHFKYTEINLIGNIPNSADLFSSISRGLVQVRKLPDDYMCIGGENISRAASKKDYILNLLEENFSNKVVESRIQPIFNIRTSTLAYGEILLRLYDALREQMLPPFDVVQTASKANKMGKFDSLNYENAVGLYNKYGSGIFRLYSYNGFSINLSNDSLDSNEWLKHLKNYLNINRTPDNFLSLEINEDALKTEKGRVQIWVKELESLHVNWAVDNYENNIMSPREIAQLGFTTVKFSRKFLINAMSDNVSKGLYQSVINECHYNNLIVVAQGIETAEQLNFVKYAGADLAQGYYLAEPLKVDDFLVAIQERSSRNITEEESKFVDEKVDEINQDQSQDKDKKKGQKRR